MTRETSPEAIDKLQRRKLELEVEIHALEREKDEASKDRLTIARKTIADVEEQLQPLLAAYENEKKRGDEVNTVRRKIEELKAKAEDAERKYDLATASDLKYYALPDLQNKLAQLERKKEEEEANGDNSSDTVTPEQIAEIVGRWTNIPVTRLLSTEKEKLLRMEKTLAESVVGQPEAVKAVANAIRLSRSGLRNSARPIASFLLCGGSGTGKTLLSKTLANLLFDSPDAMIRIDSSEYSEKHSISRLIGSPPGYVSHAACWILSNADRFILGRTRLGRTTYVSHSFETLSLCTDSLMQRVHEKEAVLYHSHRRDRKGLPRVCDSVPTSFGRRPPHRRTRTCR